MPAYPFGNHPTFGQFLARARQLGCRAQSGLVSSPSGEMLTAMKITNPGNGQSVAIVEPDMDERLVASTIGYYERRLGIVSGWFSIDPDFDD